METFFARIDKYLISKKIPVIITEYGAVVKQMPEDATQKNHAEIVKWINDYLDILAIWYRDALMFKATKDANHLIFKEEIQYIKKTAARSTYEGIEIIIKALDTAKRRIASNVNFDLTMELLLLTIKEN